MHVRVYTSFQEVAGEVRGRLSYPTQPNFFLSLDWFSLLFETSLRETLAPRIYVPLNGQGEPLGALFCGVARGGAGRRLLSLTNFYTLEYSPSVVQDQPDRQTTIGLIVAYIAAERPRWHSIRLTFLKASASETRSTLDQLRAVGFGVYPFFQYENWYFTANGETFQAYFSERPSQVRNTIVRKQKKLEKTAGFVIKVVSHESVQLEGAIRDFITVYNSSWKEPEPFPNFIPTLATICARLGILRLGVLYVAGKPTAGQLWITTQGRAIIYKLAYDEEYRDLGVGSVLSREMFRVAIDEDHVEEIDYGVGSEPYKRDWMASVRDVEGFAAFNQRSLVGILLSSMEAARTAMRRGRTLLKRK